jgi:hypothetical protein
VYFWVLAGVPNGCTCTRQYLEFGTFFFVVFSSIQVDTLGIHVVLPNRRRSLYMGFLGIGQPSTYTYARYNVDKETVSMCKSYR